MRDYIYRFLVALTASVATVCVDRALSRQSELEIANQAVCDTLSDWQMFEMAVIFTESRGQTNAVGSKGDWGVMQIRDIYVREANRLAGTEYVHEDAFDIQKSLEIFNIINPEQDMEMALKRHNPGSKGYAYRQNYEMIKRMEECRRIIKELRHE